MRILRRWAVPVSAALLMGGCRITEDMGPGEKVALGFVDVLAAVALLTLLLGLTVLAASRS